jgi:hypothetical protein
MVRNADELDGWRALLEPGAAELLAATAALPDPGQVSLAELRRLRALAAPEQVARALELVRARRRAAKKFESAELLLADLEGVEQASGTRVARHKAARFAALRPAGLVDLCCGIGGDLIELCRALPAAEVSGLDLDPLRALMAGHNAGCPVAVGDAAAALAGAAAFHIDPARRIEGGDGRRLRRLADLRPGPEVLGPLLDSDRPGAIKLGPGIALDELPGGGSRTELEIVGDREGLLQALVWCGDLAQAPGRRTATRLDRGLGFTAAPRPAPIAAGIGRFVLVPDPALERAGLVGARTGGAVGEIAAGLGLLSAEAPLDDPWFRSFEVLEVLPWRDKKIREALRTHDAGPVQVKIRGKVADANAAARAFRGTGAAEIWLLGFRLGAKAVAVLAAEVPQGP